MNFLDLLPDELVLVIFSRASTAALFALAQVNHRCRRIALDHSLWRDATLHLPDTMLLLSMAPDVCLGEFAACDEHPLYMILRARKVLSIATTTKLRVKRVAIKGTQNSHGSLFHALTLVDMLADDLESLSIGPGVTISKWELFQRNLVPMFMDQFTRLQHLTLLWSTTSDGEAFPSTTYDGLDGSDTTKSNARYLQGVLSSKLPLEVLHINDVPRIHDWENPLWSSGNVAANRIRVLRCREDSREDPVVQSGLAASLFTNLEELYATRVPFDELFLSVRNSPRPQVFSKLRTLHVSHWGREMGTATFPVLEELSLRYDCLETLQSWQQWGTAFPRLQRLILHVVLSEGRIDYHFHEDTDVGPLPMLEGRDGTVTTICILVQFVEKFAHLAELVRAALRDSASAPGVGCETTINGHMVLRRAGTEAEDWERDVLSVTGLCNSDPDSDTDTESDCD